LRPADQPTIRIFTIQVIDMCPYDRRLRALASALLLSVALCAHAQQPFNFATTPGQLPKDVVPEAYRIELAADLQRLSFTGTEQVDVNVTAATANVTLNAAALVISRAAILGAGGAGAQVSYDTKKMTATLRFAQPLPVGRHTLTLSFSGHIPETPAGIYYDDYATAAGPQRMLVTQFEAIDARRMFPCWDEPAFKATFQLTVTLPADLAVVSNTPVAHAEPVAATGGTALTKTSFVQTPRMSTYLLVLCAGHLQRIHAAAAGADIGVFAVTGKAEQGRSALEAAGRILGYYNTYFAVPYPLPKLDLIAVPGNFAAGAMENWGGITFIDNDLLLTPGSSSESTRQLIFAVVAHEMAHQWSGDLVTMAWWNDVWLNEGFASWMASKVTDALNPDWHYWLQEHSSKERAMSEDARPTTHPIQMSITDESQIGSAFDAISYQKGESFIRMLESYLGEDAFRDGMRRYMKAHAYSNATTADLWAALQKASGKPVAEIAAGFTEQPGIPLIQVAVACNGQQTAATLSQQRFTINDPKAAPLRWDVPVQVGIVGGTPSTLLVKGSATFSAPGCGKPVKANWGDTGYYRVEYDAQNLAALTAAYAVLPTADRVNLLSDQWALAAAARSPLAGYLDLTLHLGAESDYVIWQDVITRLRELDNLARGQPVRARYRQYAVKLLGMPFARIGWDPKPDEGVQTMLLRPALIDALGTLGDAQVIAESQRRFAAFLKDPSSLPANLRTPVINTVARSADQATFDQLRALGKAASASEDKLRYYYALAGAQDPRFLNEDMAIARTSEIADGRVPAFLVQIAQRSQVPDAVWQAVVAQRAPLLAKMPEGFRHELLPTIAAQSMNPAVGRELLAMPEMQASPGARYEAARAVSRIEERAEMQKRLMQQLGVWLSIHEPVAMSR
jgi:aminopeptidase N